MWLQKDDYDASHKDRPLGIVCEYPVYSIKQHNLLESIANGNVARVQSRVESFSSRQGSDASLTGSSLSSIRCSIESVRDNGNSEAVSTQLTARSTTSTYSNDKSREAEKEAGGVRTILNILDNFKLEDIKKDDGKLAPTDAEGNHQSISVVESALMPNTTAAKPEALKEKKAPVNSEECLINGMSQGDRLQHIKAMRQHARSTTTGALRHVFSWVTELKSGFCLRSFCFRNEDVILMRTTKTSFKSTDIRYFDSWSKPERPSLTNDCLNRPGNETSRIRSRTSQRLQASHSGVLLPSPLKSNRVSSAVAASASPTSVMSSPSATSVTQKSVVQEKLSKIMGVVPNGHKRVTRSTTTTKR